MFTRDLWRKLAALAASYVIAVQAVLFGLAPAAYAMAGSRDILCVNSSNPADTPHQNDAQHDTLCCLATGCASFGKVAAGPGAEVIPLPGGFDGVRLVVAHDDPVAWPNERPRSSRAPPV